MLKEYMPTVFTTARCDFSKYLANCEGIARFYHKSRLTTEIRGKKTPFITPADIFVTALRCSHLEKQMIKVIEKPGKLTKQEIQQCFRKY